MEMKKPKKGYFVLTFSILLCGLLFYTTTSGLADTGDLKINNQVIYNQKTKDAAATFVVPDLFLENKTTTDQQIRESHDKCTSEAHHLLFINNTVQTESWTKEINTQLFSADYVMPESGKNQHFTGNNDFNKAGKLLGIAFGGLLLLGGGIFLGTRFSHWLNPKK